MGYLYFGTQAISSGDAPVLGGLTLAYAGTGLASYFGSNMAPIFRLLNINAMSGIAAVMGIASLLSGNVHLVIMLLVALHSIDFAHGLSQSEKE